MFRGTIKLLRRYRENMLSLVLLPAIVLGTMPHSTCICSDGHREPACRGLACLTFRTNATHRGCSHCKNSEAVEQRSCCRAKQAQSVPGSEQLPGPTVNGGSCCHFFVENPLPATITAKGNAVQHYDLVAFIATAHGRDLAGQVRPACDLIHQTGPPPLDAVVVYQRLTI